MELFDRVLNTSLISNNYVFTKCADQKISGNLMIFPCDCQFTCCTQFSALSSPVQSIEVFNEVMNENVINQTFVLKKETPFKVITKANLNNKPCLIGSTQLIKALQLFGSNLVMSH